MIRAELGSSISSLAGERLRIDGTELARGLALGEREIVDAVLGHQACGAAAMRGRM